ncbi:MAG: DUF5050 domain-containing protein [Eubacterium sp.]|nr:DUF5050 domain-containing protein [Eubacterium sp.]
MASRVLKIVIGVLIAAVIIVAVFFGVKTVRKLFIAQNTQESTLVQSGNLGGNLYNGGSFCEKNGLVYFANPNDSYKLYSMTVFGSEQTKLCDDSVAYINVDDNYIYYTRRAGAQSDSEDFMGLSSLYQYALCRVDLDGKNVVVLDNDPCMYACLVDNNIYYMHYDDDNASRVYRIGIDGTNRQVVSEGQSFTCSAFNGVLYYNGTLNDHNLYALDNATDQVTSLYAGNAWQPTYSDGYLYFLNLNDDYSICKINLTTYEAQTIVTDSVENFNVYGGTIYYQTMSGDVGLYRCDTNGNNKEFVYSGNCCEINITSGYVYFRLYENEDVFYMTPTNSDVDVTVFVPALGVIE